MKRGRKSSGQGPGARVEVRTTRRCSGLEALSIEKGDRKEGRKAQAGGHSDVGTFLGGIRS